jgi:transcriptional regulator with XRE-family HTH domain
VRYNPHEVIEMDYVLLGKRVRIRRNILDITQASLAETIGVSTSFIGHIERGTRKLSVETLYDLCKALDTTADFLLGIK